MGIEENNDRTADFRGIEIKCKQRKSDLHAGTGKINLFQNAPVWLEKMPAIERLKTIGQIISGRFSCYSQVNTTPNNLGLSLALAPVLERIELHRATIPIGYWLNETLEERLIEKHSRAVFIKADVRKTSAGVNFRYNELVYCERPDIQRFIKLVEKNQLVFEFLMTEKPAGTVRNHGYPWRLNKEDLLDDLFAMKIRLRGES